MVANQDMEPSFLIFICVVIIMCLVALIYKCCGSQHGSQYGRMQTIQNESTRRYTRSSPSIDLHGYTVAHARDAVEEFLRRCSDRYTSHGQSADRYVYIVTGWGRHSPGGYGAIKDAVQSYLTIRGYRYTWNNAGEAEVDLGGRYFS